MSTNVIYNPALAGAYLASDHPLDQVMYESLMKQLGDIRGTKILDLGCGGGRSSRFLAKAGARVTGIDIAEDMLTAAMAEEVRNPLDIRYMHGDARNLDLGETYDVVVPSFLLHYAERKIELARFCRTIAKHLSFGGTMVALNTPPEPIVPWVPGNSHWTEWVDPSQVYQEGAQVRLHRVPENGGNGFGFEYYFWTKETYESLLHKAGFSCIQWHDHPFPESLKAQFPNWEVLATHNASCLLTAVRA